MVKDKECVSLTSELFLKKKKKNKQTNKLLNYKQDAVLSQKPI